MPLTAALALILVPAILAPAVSHAGDPEYESTITSVTGMPDGVEVEVLGDDDRLAIDNDSGKDLLVRGYEGEPYARIAADGTISVNDDSPATYLSVERDGRVSVPDDVDGEGEPRWRVVDRSGSFAWYDHRIHWMADTRPPQVTDPEQDTTVFAWSVPVSVDGREEPATISGTLSWIAADDGGASAGVIAALVAVLAGGALLVLTQRRRGFLAGPRPMGRWTR